MKLRYLFFCLLICMPVEFASLTAEVTEVPLFTEELPPSDPDVNLMDIKNIPDLYFECQIAQMSAKSTIPLFYNPLVREYIEIFLVGRKHQIPGLTILSEKYFPLFEAKLETYGLPKELKYIPIIESGLNPIAKSPSGAYGLWQFKAETGRSFGLVVNENSDDRTDPSKSTVAACDYLTYLYGMFGDWQLSLLAYHAGPSTVKNAIKKAGGKTSFNAISVFLPVPTQRYIPSYIAMMYVLNNYKKHI